jgi:transposase
MSPKPHHSPHKRTRIVWRYNSGISAARIAREEGVSRHAIYGVVRRYQEQQSARDQPRHGRPHKLTKRDLRRVLLVIGRDPHIVISELIEEAGLSCHAKTLTSTLRREGIMHFQSLLRPFISPETARKRLRFAHRYINQSEESWSRWTFSDETIVARGEGQRRTWVFCKPVCVSFAIAALLMIPSMRDYSEIMFRPGSRLHATHRCSSAPSTAAGGCRWCHFTEIQNLNVVV